MAKNVAGASGYGSTLGREVVKNGIALGRTLYLGHGLATGSGTTVFEDDAEMLAAGFTPYCSGPANARPVEDASDLSKHLRAVGITFAYKCATTAAFNFMTAPNATSFSRSTAGSVGEGLAQLNSQEIYALLDHYNRVQVPAEITQVLDREQPGKNDLFSVLLEQAVTRSRTRAVGFQRRGPLGFDVLAVPLAEETVKMIMVATKDFDW
jgi:hypothetical protein